MSNVRSAVTLELPKTNRFWSDERLKKFLTDHDMQKFADCAACAMGLRSWANAQQAFTEEGKAGGGWVLDP